MDKVSRSQDSRVVVAVGIDMAKRTFPLCGVERRRGAHRRRDLARVVRSPHSLAQVVGQRLP